VLNAVNFESAPKPEVTPKTGAVRKAPSPKAGAAKLEPPKKKAAVKQKAAIQQSSKPAAKPLPPLPTLASAKPRPTHNTITGREQNSQAAKDLAAKLLQAAKKSKRPQDNAAKK
jgi:hypothetical protein